MKYVTSFMLLKVLKNILRPYPFTFTLRFIFLNLKLSKFEKNIPFKGVIGLNKGWFKTKLSNKSITTLERTYNFYKSKNRIEITLDNIFAFEEIFNNVGKKIKDYLGKNVKVDGMFFLHSKSSHISTSSNWHTDNVGSRIKVFVCIEGDGSQPTLLSIPSKSINNLSYLLKIYFHEVNRWIGFNFRNKLKNVISLRHKKGSIFSFDTAVLHRGCYEQGVNNRTVLVLEFSNPDKHKLLSSGLLKGPIGTSKKNQFVFKKIDNIPHAISSFLDEKRIFLKNNLVYYEQLLINEAKIKS